jgi:hypothetical protein
VKICVPSVNDAPNKIKVNVLNLSGKATVLDLLKGACP